MHIMHRRGWEIPEHQATPEHLFFDRRTFLAAAGAAAIGLSPAGALAQRANERSRSDRRPLSGEAQRDLQARPAGDAGGDQHDLQQLLRIRLVEIDLARRPGAQAAAVDGQDRRHGGEAPGPSPSTTSSARCRLKSGSTATAASRRGAWRSRGPASRSRSSSRWRDRCRRRNTCGWKPSSIPPWRAGSARAGTPGLTSKA